MSLSLPERGWVNPSGPRDRPLVAVVGSFPDEEDERIGLPFSGKSGGMLASMLKRVGIRKSDCYQTCVFLERPQFNSIENWCMTKREVEEAWREAGNAGKYPYPSILRSKLRKAPLYLEPDRVKVLERLKMELEQVRPNLVLALGGIASWALLGSSSIHRIRGTLVHSTLVDGIKVLPTHHPGDVLKQWDLFPIAISDLGKAARTRHTPELIVPKRYIWTEPSLTDLWDFYNQHLAFSTCIAVDVETQARQITCIGFAASRTHALVVPFWDTNNKLEPNYWKTEREEAQALQFVRRVLLSPTRKVFQNGLYDIQYIWKTWGCPINGPLEDTMILHHALQPELQKGLGFLGSIYTDEPSWKHMRKRKSDTEKRDE